MVVNRSCRKNLSFGVSVGSAACESVSSAERERLFFQTTKESEISGLPVPPLYRAKNKDTGLVSNKVSRKYFAKTAPLPDRSYSTTVREHDSKDFLDLSENKVMFNTFKNPLPNVIPGLTSSGSDKPDKTPSLGSSYASFFPAHSRRQRKAAAGEAVRYSESHVVGCPGYSASGSSTYLELHKLRPGAGASDGFSAADHAANNERSRSHLFLAPYTEHSLKSQYGTAFRSSRDARLAESDRAREILRSMSSPEIHKQLHPHTDILCSTRVCGMDTGR